MEKSLLKYYFKELDYDKKPEFLNKYLNTPSLLRLKESVTFVE